MFRRIVHQQVYVVYLAVHLYQLSLEIEAHLVEDDFEPTDSIGVKYLFPILGYEDQVDMKLRNAVYTVSEFT